MASMIINGNDMTDIFENSGDAYIFDPAPVIGTNGDGSSVVLPYAVLVMHWALLPDAEMTDILTDILVGASSKECTGTTKLFDNNKTLQTYSHCRVYRPQTEGFQYGYHKGVTLRISEIT